MSPVESGFSIMLIAAAAAAVGPAPAAPEEPECAHLENTFAFAVRFPLSRVAPLFGADRERVWAEGWDPTFLHPRPAADREGAVFSIVHGAHRAVWITTVFDPEHGHIQHVYFVPEVMVTRIDIRLDQPGSSTTHVKVTYERTALSPAHNAQVRRQGEADAGYGAHWQQAIEAFLATTD